MITRAQLEAYRRLTDHHRRSPAAKAFRRELEAALAALPRDLKRLIVLRYCLRFSWRSVAMKMNYSEPHIFRLHKKSCKVLEEVTS